MKRIYIILFMLLIGFSLDAQEVVSSGGKTQSASGYELSWTVGEAVTTTVSGGANTLTQGFQQSNLTITAIGELLNSDLVLKVYPNPAQDFVVIQINKLENQLTLYLYDLSGNLLESKPISATETRLNLNKYASGTYLLKLTRDSHQTLQTFKIIKR